MLAYRLLAISLHPSHRPRGSSLVDARDEPMFTRDAPNGELTSGGTLMAARNTDFGGIKR